MLTSHQRPAWVSCAAESSYVELSFFVHVLYLFPSFCSVYRPTYTARQAGEFQLLSVCLSANSTELCLRGWHLEAVAYVMWSFNKQGVGSVCCLKGALSVSLGWLHGKGCHGFCAHCSISPLPSVGVNRQLSCQGARRIMLLAAAAIVGWRKVSKEVHASLCRHMPM